MTVGEMQDSLAQTIRQEIADWFERYSRAWDAGDIDTIVALTDPTLTGRMVMMDGKTIWDASYDAEIDGIRGFLAYAATHRVVNDHQLYDVAVRAPNEAIAVTRKTVQILEGDDPRTVTQFAIETLRRDESGNWLLVRYWAEKARYTDV